ncbi:MAG TPA: NfeD family protein [Caproicibacter sp.]|nr:NfeD family protein [Caproicibacter sp.]
MMPFIWLGIIIVSAVVEMATTQLVSIWFSVGGIGALIACELNAPFPLQILIFLFITALMLAVTRPFVRKALVVKKTNTNADRYLGKIAIVTVEINNTVGTGQVNVLGSIWTARSADGATIPVGQRVLVEAIDGVKLIVRLKTD